MRAIVASLGVAMLLFLVAGNAHAAQAPARAPAMSRAAAASALKQAGFGNLTHLTQWFDGWEAVAKRGNRTQIVTIENRGAIVAPSDVWFPPVSNPAG